MKNKTACIAPWIHLHTWPNNSVYPCCLTPMDMPVGNLNDQSLSKIWNNDELKKLRLHMLAGKKPKRCTRCFEQESVGQYSFRMHMNKEFKHHKHLWNKTNSDGSVDNMNLAYWDIRFSNICNMKCRTCGPQLSTGWYEDTKKLWGQLPDDIPNPIKNLNMWEQIEPFFQTVEEIYFAGGEPLIMEEHYWILERLLKDKLFKTKIRYNTNFSQLRYKKTNVLDLWKKFKFVEIGASLDGFGKKAEYIRKGTDWKVIEHNRTLLRKNVPDAKFFINCTISVLNAYHIIEFYDWAINTQFIEPHQFHFNLVQHPTYMRLQILPDYIKKDLTKKYKKVVDDATSQNIIDGFNMLISYMNSDDLSYLIPEFKSVTNRVDSIRNENFIEVFPELKDLMK